jgi:hypothetical protein
MYAQIRRNTSPQVKAMITSVAVRPHPLKCAGLVATLAATLEIITAASAQRPRDRLLRSGWAEPALRSLGYESVFRHQEHAAAPAPARLSQDTAFGLYRRPPMALPAVQSRESSNNGCAPSAPKMS